MSDEEVPAIIEVAMDGLLKHYKDGTLRFAITIDPPHAQLFLKHFLEIGTRAGIAKLGPPGTAPAPVKPKGPYGQEARILRMHTNWMGNPKVWASFGSDLQFLDWCAQQPCCWESGDHGGDVVAAHVRRVANGAGTGIKPIFSAVPLCCTHHDLQHRHGESAGGGKEWFDHQRMKHVHAWLWSRMKLVLMQESMTELPPVSLRAFAEQHGLLDCLPDCYRQAR